MDGAPWWNIFLRIVVPLSKPAIAAYSAVTLLDSWNLYAWPLVAATDPDMQVLPVVLASLNNSQYSTTPLSVGLAQVLVTTLPLVVAFVFAERWFVQGIAGSGLKG
jgi:ABC-type glycerol-3-phosphate transport system permease component